MVLKLSIITYHDYEKSIEVVKSDWKNDIKCLKSRWKNVLLHAN